MKQYHQISYLILILFQVSISISFQFSTVHRDGHFKSPCGTEKEVASRVGSCLASIQEIAEGRVQKPTSDADLQTLANRFTTSEKCIRQTARECLSGLHKSTTSSVAASSRRFRTSEWKDASLRAKYFDPVACSIKLSNKIIAVYHNHTGIIQAIRDDTSLKPEQKLTKVCCIFNELDHDLSRVYNTECPDQTAIVLKIIHALTEDARTTVCVSPKCNNFLKPYTNSHYKPSQQFIEPIMEVFFGLSTGVDSD